MATTGLTMTIDTTPVAALCDAMARVVERLPSARGRSALALMRRLQRIADGERTIDPPRIVNLGGGKLLALPPRVLVEIVDRAAALRII